MDIASATFSSDELERVDASRMVVLASGGPLMVVRELRTAGEFGVDPNAPVEALCSWVDAAVKERMQWFDVRLLRMLVSFDVKAFVS